MSLKCPLLPHSDVGLTRVERLVLTRSGHSSPVSPMAASDPKRTFTSRMAFR